MPNTKQVIELKGPAFARILGVTTRTLYNLRAEGMPHRADGNEVWYPMPTANEWYWRRTLAREAEKQPAPSAPDGDRVSHAEAERRKTLADAEKREIEVKQLRGELVDLALFRSTLANVVQRLRGFILGHTALRGMADEILTELRAAAPSLEDEHAETEQPAGVA